MSEPCGLCGGHGFRSWDGPKPFGKLVGHPCIRCGVSWTPPDVPTQVHFDELRQGFDLGAPTGDRTVVAITDGHQIKVVDISKGSPNRKALMRKALDIFNADTKVAGLQPLTPDELVELQAALGVKLEAHQIEHLGGKCRCWEAVARA
jgi:hypothetical protein